MGVAAEIQVGAASSGLLVDLGRVCEKYLEPLRGRVPEGKPKVVALVVVGIVDTHQPDTGVLPPQLHGIVDEHGDTRLFEVGQHLDAVMVAQHAIGTVTGPYVLE